MKNGKLHGDKLFSGSRQQRPKPVWAPPPAGWAKLNSASYFVEETGEAFAGCVVRNCNGEVLLSAWGTLPPCAGKAEADAEAILFACKLCQERCVMPTILDIERQDILQGLSSFEWPLGSSSSWTGPSLYSGFIQLMIDVSFNLVNKGCNRIAHALALLAKRGVVAAVLQLESPLTIAELLAQDCKNIISI